MPRTSGGGGSSARGVNCGVVGVGAAAVLAFLRRAGCSTWAWVFVRTTTAAVVKSFAPLPVPLPTSPINGRRGFSVRWASGWGKRSGNGRGALVAAAVCFPCGSATSAVVIVSRGEWERRDQHQLARPWVGVAISSKMSGATWQYRRARVLSRVSCVDLIVLEHLGQFLYRHKRIQLLAA